MFGYAYGGPRSDQIGGGMGSDKGWGWHWAITVTRVCRSSRKFFWVGLKTSSQV